MESLRIAAFFFIIIISAVPCYAFRAVFPYQIGNAQNATQFVIQIQSYGTPGEENYRFAWRVRTPSGGSFNPASPESWAAPGMTLNHDEVNERSFYDAFRAAERWALLYGGPGTKKHASSVLTEGEWPNNWAPSTTADMNAVVGVLISLAFLIGWKFYV